MLGLAADAEFPQLVVQFAHEDRNAVADRAVVVVILFLAFGAQRPDDGPSGEAKIGPLLVVLPVDQEILLFGTDVDGDPFRRGVSQRPQDPQGLLLDRLIGSEQGNLLVQRLAFVGEERGGDVQHLIPCTS